MAPFRTNCTAVHSDDGLGVGKAVVYVGAAVGDCVRNVGAGVGGDDGNRVVGVAVLGSGVAYDGAAEGCHVGEYAQRDGGSVGWADNSGVGSYVSAAVGVYDGAVGARDGPQSVMGRADGAYEGMLVDGGLVGRAEGE